MCARLARNLTLEGALKDSEERFVRANPLSRRSFDDACKVMPGGNTRTVLFYSPFPLTVQRGEGAYVWDADGHRYTDFLGEYTAGLYGHSNPVIRRAVEEALAGGTVLGGPNQYEGRFAALLCARFPSLELVRFTNSGTEANLMALSAARAVTGRNKVMAFHGAYHGGVLFFHHGGSPLNAPYPMVMAPYNDAQAAVELVDRHADDLAAVIVEPMLGGGGCIPGEPAFLEALREATMRHGIILIFDEVMTSRLGPGGLQGELGVIPDLTTLGKYVGGGLTFGAFGGRAEIMARFDPCRPDAFPHHGTFNNNVLTMAAGLAGLGEVFTPEAAVRLNAGGDGLRDRLNALFAKHGVEAQVTGQGSMMTVHFRLGYIQAPEGAPPHEDATRALLHLDLLERGQYLARRGMIMLSLPMTDADLDGLVSAMDDFLEERADLVAA